MAACAMINQSDDGTITVGPCDGEQMPVQSMDEAMQAIQSMFGGDDDGDEMEAMQRGYGQVEQKQTPARVFGEE